MDNKFTIPANIEPEAKTYMDEVLAMLEAKNLMADVDTAALRMLAENYSLFIKASKVVDEEGLTITAESGIVRAHPAVKIARDAQSSAMALMAKYGLTAKDRSNLPAMDGELSPLEAFVKGSKEYR